MKKIQTVIFGLTIGLSAIAEPSWVNVTESDFESIYLDSKSVMIHGPMVVVDELINRHKTDAVFKVVSFISRVEYDCLNEEKATIRLVTTTEFFGRGEVQSDTSKSTRWRGSGYTSIDDGSKFYKVMESLCISNPYFKKVY
ncbi:hypothetical protein MCEMAEM4_02674 [Burkholderiaceae bacterium]